MSGRSFRDIMNEQLRIGAATAWVNPGISVSNTVPISTRFEDPEGLYPYGTPLPVNSFATPTAINGDGLGYFDGGISISPSLNKNKKKAGGSISHYKSTISDEGCTVKGNLVLNQRKHVWKYLTPPGVKSTSEVYWGGKTEFDYYPLLIVMSNSLNKNIVQCMLFFRGFFDPQEFKTGNIREFEPVSMAYEVVAGRDASDPNCFRPAGYRMAHIWWQNLVTGNVVAPY